MKRCTKVFLSACLLGLAAFEVAAADRLADGRAAYQDNDFVKAARILRPLATRGNPEAEFILGNMYDKGLGVSQDCPLAVKWFRKAADRGNIDAQRMLGSVYDLGRPDVPPDIRLAADWYRKAADQGDAASQRALARAYEEGRGVPKDLVQAYMWFDLTAAHAGSDVDGDIALVERKRLAANLTPAQIAEAQRLASKWKPIAH